MNNLQKLAIDFHKAVGRECRAGSNDYGYLTSWGGMPEYDRCFECTLYAADELAGKLNIPWNLTKKDGNYIFEFGDKLLGTDNICQSIMQPVVDYISSMEAA